MLVELRLRYYSNFFNLYNCPFTSSNGDKGSEFLNFHPANQLTTLESITIKITLNLVSLPSLPSQVRGPEPEHGSLLLGWLTQWKTFPTHTITSMFELYEQLLPTRLYVSQKTHTNSESGVDCRLCGKAQESVSHILSGCSALAQSKYLSRHDSTVGAEGAVLRNAT